MKSQPSLNDYFDHPADLVSSNNCLVPYSTLAQTQIPSPDTPNAEGIMISTARQSRRISADGICDMNDTEEIISPSTVTDANFSPFVSDDLSTASALSPLLIAIVHAALDVPLTPMTARRKAAILDAIVAKNIPTAIFYEMAAVYVRRAEILSKGFSLKYLAPVGKQRNRGRPKGHVKRPLNSFMIYRRVQTYLFHASSRESATCDDEIRGIVKFESSLLGDLERTSHQSVSVIIGQLWRTENQTVRDAFAKLAEQESSLHRELHPDYKYCPQKKARRHSSAPSSSPITLARSHHRPPKLVPACQLPRMILPNTVKPKLTDQCDVQDSYALEILSLPTAMSHSSPIFTPTVSPEDFTLPPGAIDEVWPTIPRYDQSDASSSPSPDYVCIPLSSSPERDLNSPATIRITDDYCRAEKQQYDIIDDVQIDDMYVIACGPDSCLPTTYLQQRTRPSYLLNTATVSSLSAMDQSNTYLAADRTVTNSTSFAQHLTMRSRNTMQDSEYDNDVEQNFNREFNMWTGNSYCVDPCT
ncbi:hypothetical protein V1525DRAFT_407024 [Lipomyces kononenkoae]|uniref:Uncharacterized protein n=1 Tax=Lipomyces kononenkoae TaxID=34357 RepID=A0ACC3T064_LIPKO